MDTCPPAPPPSGDSRSSRALRHGELICRQRGLKLTSLRRAVLAAIADSPQPIGAYRLLAQLQATTGTKIAPPTIYRTLDFLMRLELIARVESRNAYLYRGFPFSLAAPVLFLCERCDGAEIVDDPALRGRLEDSALALGFHVERPMVECVGTCRRCAEADPAPIPQGISPDE